MTEHRLASIDGSTETVRQLVELVALHNLAELDIEEDGVRVTIKGLVPDVVPVAAFYPPPTAALPAAQGPISPAAARQKAIADGKGAAALAGLTALESPMVGMFFRAASPADPPFVSIGDVVRVGQAIGLIEAMKVYSEVPAEHAGRVVDILIENGTLVHQGDPLMYLEPL